MARAVRKGDRLTYTGPYITAQDMRDMGIPDHLCQDVSPYPAGTVVAFRDYRTKVTVQLDAQPGDTQELFADWPIDQVAPVE